MSSTPTPPRPVLPPAPYRRFIRIRSVGMVGVLLAAVGCDAGSHSGSITAPFETPVASSAAAADLGWVAGWSAPSLAALQPQLQREQERIREARERSQAEFESLRQEAERGIRRTPKSSAAFLWCAPDRYEAETRVIGPEGGQIVVGRHRLSIPRGALTQPTVITAEIPVSTVASVRFSPHGLHFARPASLTLDFRHCAAASGAKAVYFDDDHRVLEWPSTTVSGGRATVEIRHFSIYGMASG